MDVDKYIQSAPPKIRPALKEIRKAIKQAAPKALEKISYGMPYYSYKGRLAYFSIHKEHIGFYLMPPILAAHEKQVAKYQTSKSTLRFKFNERLPLPLIKKLIKASVKANEKQDL